MLMILEESVPVLGDVEDVAIGRPDEEPANAPRLGREWVHDLLPTPLRLVERGLHVINPDRGDRVLGGSGVARHELDARTAVRRGESVATHSIPMLSTVIPR